jgi:uncharacterized protein YjbI with pentapeptide repeats
MDAEEWAMNTLKTRWQNDPQLQVVYRFVLDSSPSSTGMTPQELYALAPKAAHPIQGEAIDYRGLNIDGKTIGKSWLDGILDGASARGCTFEGTRFQSASAADSDFTSSRFVVAQMSPFYGPRAIFKDCVFEDCFMMGIGPRSCGNGSFSDLRECDFTGVRATKTGFDRCDFTGANMNGARFVGCQFDEADLRGVSLSGASFEGCDLREVQMDDTPALRQLVEAGANANTDSIKWSPPA